MNHKVKYGVAAIAAGAAAAAGAYLCWPKTKVEAPEDTCTLDMSKTYNGNRFLLEEGYRKSMKTIVEPYLKDHMVSGYFDGYDGNKLYYEQYPSKQHKAHIVIAHGYTDGCYKFRESIYYFLQTGYSVSIMDHRGHGYSYRQAEDDLCKVTIGNFDEYIQDFCLFIQNKVKPVMAEGEKLYFHGHSMGGGIGALILEKSPDLFDAAILIAPMMELLYGGMPENTALTITRGESLLGRKEHYILGSGSFRKEENWEESGMDSKVRYQYLHEVQVDDEHYQTSGGTYAWLTAAVKACEEIRKNAEKACTPTLLFQAGEDTTVGPDGQNEYAAKAQNVQLIQVPATKHCIPFAGNDVFIPYMNTVLEFYEKHL